MLQRLTHRLSVVWFVMVLLVSSFTACSTVTKTNESPIPHFEPVLDETSQVPDVSWELRITGAVAEPATFSYRDLAERELVLLDDILERCECGDETLNTWEGIPLGDLMAEVGASEDATGVVFRGADGYWREAPVSDLDVAMVALRRDGVWLADDPEEGPIRMVVPGQSASYWISQLVEIEIVE